MREYSEHQRKIISRYYDHRDTIMLDRLAQLVSDLYVARTDKERDRLWTRAAAAMKNLKVSETTAAHILSKRKPEILASHLSDWLNAAPGG